MPELKLSTFFNVVKSGKIIYANIKSKAVEVEDYIDKNLIRNRIKKIG